MRLVEIAKEMKEIVESNKPVRETRFFSTTGLDRDTVRWGCLRILRWLTNEYTMLNGPQDKLDLSVMVDRSCSRLLAAVDTLQDLITITDGCLAFSRDISRQEIEEALRWIGQDTHTYTFFTPRKGADR